MVRNLEMYQYDSKNAYVRADVKEELYVQLPNLIENGLWLVPIQKATLKGNLRYTSSWSMLEDMYLIVYVDDIIVFAPAHKDGRKILADVKGLELLYLGKAKHFLGSKLEENREGTILALRQPVYIEANQCTLKIYWENLG
eukprot:Pgem_evm1s4396